jgi:hypothetical protein
MKTYKVLDPKGIHVAGKHYPQGETVRLGRGAQLNAFLHFKQVEEAADAPEPKAKPKGKAKAGAEGQPSQEPANDPPPAGDPPQDPEAPEPPK